MLDPAVTVLLDRARTGDAEALGRLVGQLYGELRAIAHAQRRRLGAADTVNTTAVVHEAYAKLDGHAGGDGQAFADRTHFFRVAARAMRDVIVDYARAQRTAKRGGDGRPVSLDAVGPVAEPATLDPTEVLSLDAALRDLERFDPEGARVAELRYFGGLSVEETAEALDLSPATVKRRWAMARAWLYRRLHDDPDGENEADNEADRAANEPGAGS
ncbi:MAG TPA: ECF-type sigma factor [Rhodothermales bacterium]|nr:ECF-type sigma factor [Rhodothermales bacterium]